MATASSVVAMTIIFLGLFADYVLFSDSSESLFLGQNLTYDASSHRLPYGPHVLSFHQDRNIVLYQHFTLLPDGENNMAVVAAKTLVIIFVGLVNIAPNYADYVIYSDSSQSLLPGQNLTYDMTPHRIPFGPHVLSFKDCNINLYKLGNLAWSTNTSSFSGQDCYLTLLPDGELVLRRNFHYPIWSSGVKSVPGSYAFMMGWDGGLGIVGPELWSNSDEALAISDPDPMITTTDYVFYSGQVTTFTYGIVVTYKNLRLVLREDCNLVLEDMNTWKILWQTNTYSPHRDCFVRIEQGGELMIKHNRRDILWRTGKRAPPSSPNNNFRLILRYDGRLVIYGPLIWSAATPIYNSPAAARFASS